MSRRPRSKKVCQLSSLFFTLGKDKCVRINIKALISVRVHLQIVLLKRGRVV